MALPILIRSGDLKSAKLKEPRIPEKFIWSVSSLKLFRKCKRKFFWQYIMGLRTKKRAAALTIGIAFHDSLMDWYTHRRKPMKAICARGQLKLQKQELKLVDLYDQADYDKLSAQVEAFYGMCMGYANIYARDRKRWYINKNNVEKKFTIDMGDFGFTGYIDLMPKIKGKYSLLDHKTASKIDADYIDRLPLDTQVRGYVFAARKAFDINIKEVIYNVIRKTALRRKGDESSKEYNERIRLDYESRPDNYFYREHLKFQKDSIDAFVNDLKNSHKELIEILKNHDHPDNPNSWTVNDSNCNEYFRLCPFIQLCTTGLDRGTALMFDQWKKFKR